MRLRTSLKPLLAVLLAAIASASLAQTTTSPPPPACESSAHRAFDFWVGEWEVTGGPKLDQVVGHNTIERAASGCALYEHWRNSTGQDGRSLNVYEPASKQWTQFWIGADGVTLRLNGGIDGADMLMHGSLATAKGTQQQRIRWSPQADGSVVQRWETSDDDGTSWQISFVGIYRRSTH
ncbi:MAG: hypothetical protein ACT4NL_04730 [Pseudomarimonas sp.]